MLTGLVLPFRFDAARLQADLALVQPEEWSPHYNEGDYGGVWRGAALRSTTGTTNHLVVKGPDARPFVDTPLLDRCACFREVLNSFPCPLRSVRLLGLAPNSFIREHCDNALDYEDGEIRIHIPIQTNPGVEFYLCGERLLLEEGGCYYVNVNLPHRASNRGSAERVHLVIDATVDGWVRELFERGQTEEARIPRLPAPSATDEFRLALIRDGASQRRLGGIADRRDFCATAARLADELGFDCIEADIDAALRGRPVAVTDDLPAESGWTPVSMGLRDGRPVAEWISTGDKRIGEPFSEESVRECLRLPLTALLRCERPLKAADATSVPAGFIYHMSRCGSTLIARMLAAAKGVSVISEADGIDRAIRADAAAPGMTREEHILLLRRFVGAMVQKRCVIKLDAWHISYLPLIRAAFPDTPWVFVYRHPLEVMASHQTTPGIHALPGGMEPEPLGLEFADISRLKREEWCAQVLAGFLRSALAVRNEPGGLFLDYRRLPEAVMERVAPHFGLPLSDDDVEPIRERTRANAKNPRAAFQRDSEEKQAMASPEIRQLSRELLEPLYAELCEGV